MEKNIAQYAKTFVNELMALKRLSKNTYQAYIQDLEVFKLFMQSNNSKNLLQDFYHFLAGQNIAQATMARRMNTVMQFMEYCNKNKLAKFDLANKPKIKVQKQYAAFMESEDLEKLRNVLTDSKKDIRLAAIIEVLYSTGMRISELLNFRVEELRQVFEKKSLLIKGKGDYLRYIFFNDASIKALEIYIHEYALAEFVFQGSKGKALTRQRVFQMLKEVANRAEVDPDTIFPHSFRHRMLTDLVQGNADLVSVQKIAGHRQINTTAIYTHVEDSLYDDILKYHPVESED